MEEAKLITKKPSVPSVRSKVSSQYISQLESQIETEKQQRVKMQKEINDIKKMNKELMDHIKSQTAK